MGYSGAHTGGYAEAHTGGYSGVKRGLYIQWDIQGYTGDIQGLIPLWGNSWIFQIKFLKTRNRERIILNTKHRNYK